MQTSKIKQWAALLLTFSGMAVAPLTVTAQNLVVSNSTVTVSGTHYDSTGGVPLAVSGSLGSFTGRNITVTSTFNSTYGVNATTRSTVNLTDSTITTTGSGNSFAVNNNNSTVRLDHVVINTTGPNGYANVTISGGYTEINHSQITTLE